MILDLFDLTTMNITRWGDGPYFGGRLPENCIDGFRLGEAFSSWLWRVEAEEKFWRVVDD